MRLIANKPCSFGGRRFFINDEIPENLVADAKMQQQLGVISMIPDGDAEVPAGKTGTFFTQKQVNEMVSAAVEEYKEKQEELEQAIAEMKEIEPGAFEGTVQIAVKGESDGENAQLTAVPATPEEIQKVFEVLQMNADEGVKAIYEVKSESVLILLHAVDARKTIKDAARKQAENLFSVKAEGADT